MKRMRKWAIAGLAAGSGLILVWAEPGASQVRVSEALACPTGFEEGDLGIKGLDCVGECTLTIKEEGKDRSWFFTTEPRVLGVDGPADGILQAGDFLVAIDGIPITTNEGGRRFANLQPGESVMVRFRREGRVGEARIEVGASCLEMPVPPGVTARVAPPPPPPDQVRPARGVAVSPRVRVAPERRSVGVAEEVEVGVGLGRRATAGLLAGSSPTGRLGVGFQCTECGTQTDDATGESVWFFSGPLEVTAVNVGGPAYEAGVQRGDLIKAIDGKALETDEGGLAFTRIIPGEAVRLTLVKRNGSEVEISLVPEEAVSSGLAEGRRGFVGLVPRRGVGVTARSAERAPGADPSPPRPPREVPETVVAPAPTAAVTAPEGMPLRYSGSINGVEVEVRGDPVTVSEMKGARTIYINAEGLWIRITVPREREVRGGESAGVGSTILR